MKYIIFTNPKVVNYSEEEIKRVETKVRNEIVITDDELNDLLDYICYRTRCTISDNIENDDFSNKDLEATSIIANYLNDLNVTYHVCNTKENIDEDVINNNFLIAEFNVDLYGTVVKIPYIIDVTYRQFFIKEKCNSNYRVIKNGLCIRTEYPGYFIHPYDFEEITSFLENGYALFDPDFANIYGNSFLNTKAFRKNYNLLQKNNFEHYDNMIKGSKTKLLTKEALAHKNLLIEPISTPIKKM